MKTVTAAIFRRGDRILLTRRNRGSRLAGKWEFPGGKVEGNETPEDCLQREIQEELCVTVRVGKLLCSSEFVYDHGSFCVQAYWVEIVEGRLTRMVHDRMDWVQAHELRKYNLLAADVPIADAVSAFCGRREKRKAKGREPKALTHLRVYRK
jgi:8-oxo-dGTP diphosphatase